MLDYVVELLDVHDATVTKSARPAQREKSVGSAWDDPEQFLLGRIVLDEQPSIVRREIVGQSLASLGENRIRAENLLTGPGTTPCNALKLLVYVGILSVESEPLVVG